MKKYLFVLITIAFILPAHAADFYVDKIALGVQDGSSWSDAFHYFQDALSVAGSGDNIYLAEGKYFTDAGAGQTSHDRESTFSIPSGVSVYGGYANGGGSRDITGNETILSGSIGSAFIATDNAYIVVTIDNVSSGTRLDGITISEGYGSGPEGYRQGGGIRIDSSAITIAN